jgi:hypothetical protein
MWLFEEADKDLISFIYLFHHQQKIDFWDFYFVKVKTLRSEGAENIPLGSQVSDLCFWKQNCIRNPKMGPKQSIKTFRIS